mmetsp:Transcript_34431/g.101201  ORF Transcript_34431/g.101201 Transcript_34431/m.101201 type:complete len:85 (-) Transcript_34431:107-361(-)
MIVRVIPIYLDTADSKSVMGGQRTTVSKRATCGSMTPGKIEQQRMQRQRMQQKHRRYVRSEKAVRRSSSLIPCRPRRKAVYSYM